MSTRYIKISVIVLGITSIVTQIILLREFLNVFYGNELVIGIVLASWMLLNGIGAYLGKFLKSSQLLAVSCQLLVSFIPLLTVFSLYSLRNNIFPVGTMLSLSSTFISTFLLLIPYCLISGFMFTLFCQILSDGNNTIPKVYSLDIIGSILGGLVLNLVLIFYLNSFQILTVLVFINLITSLFLSLTSKKKIFVLLSCILILVLCVCIYRYDFEQIGKERLFKGQKIALQKDTPYGNIVITKTEEQLNFYENGVFLFSNENLIQKEEDVHYAMLQSNSPKQVLLISGGISGTIDEILKYKVDRVDYLELNPWIVEKQCIASLHIRIKDSRVNIINKDAVFFLNTKRQTVNTNYDIALINVPPPSTAQLNRFYTFEFLRTLKKHLNDSAVISLSLMSTADYVTKEAGELNFVLYNTLKKVFKNVLIIPGQKNYFLASDKPLNIKIAELITKRKTNNEQLTTNYVNQYYIEDELLKQRSDFILNSISHQASIRSQRSAFMGQQTMSINRDFSPVAYYLQLQYWLSHFSKQQSAFSFQILIWFLAISVLCLLIYIYYFFRHRSYDLGLATIYLSLFTTGFTASSIQFLLLIYFQVMYGYVYQMTGILITLFMFGLAAGTYLSRLEIITNSIKKYSGLVFCLAIYTIAIPFILLFLKYLNANSTIIQIIFFFITIDIGTLTGMIFTYAVRMQKSTVTSIAAKSYSSDLIGSAIGVFIVSAFLLPLLGLVKVSLFIGMLNIVSGTILLSQRTKLKS